MRSDLASLFHLLSAISFMKSTWPPCCILIKNSFCAALKKVGALFPILGDDGGTVKGAGAICLLSAGFGDRGGFHFSVTLLHCSDDVGVPPGAARASPHEGFMGFMPQIHVDLGSGRREAAAARDGKTDPCSRHDVPRGRWDGSQGFFREFTKRETF